MVRKEVITICISFIMALGLIGIIAAMALAMQKNDLEKSLIIADIEIINDNICREDITPTL